MRIETPLMQCQRNVNNSQTGGFQIPSKFIWPNSWISQIVMQWIPDCKTSRSEEHRRCRRPATSQWSYSKVRRCLIPETQVNDYGKIVLAEVNHVSKLVVVLHWYENRWLIMTKKQRDSETKTYTNKGSGHGSLTMVLCLRSYWVPWAGLKLTIVFVSGRKQVTHHDKETKGYWDKGLY